MKYRLFLYLSLSVVAIASVLGAWLLPVNDIAKTIAGLPFVGALFVALFQLVRDHSSFVKETAKQQRDHAFVVAASSHMSKVVFDKHVDFSELYVEQLLDILSNLFARGPSKDGIEYVRPLYEIRRKYRLWVSSTMATTLDDFEHKIVRMGASYGLWEATQYQTGTNKSLDEAYELFKDIVDIEETDSNKLEIDEKKHKGYNLVIKHLQDILGIEKLTELRDSIINDSYSNH